MGQNRLTHQTVPIAKHKTVTGSWLCVTAQGKGTGFVSGSFLQASVQW